MKSTRVLIRAKGRGLCIERGLYDCLQKELFADVTLNCVGGKVRANKGVLAAASPVLCHLLKDWPLTEDPCIIMAGYTEEEVQGLIRYIYTGQLSAPRIQGSSWEKIIEDFKVGAPLEHDDDMASIHELTDYNDISPLVDNEPNGICHQQHQIISRNPIKATGPKIVAVTSPRPLIVQVQSLTQAQSVEPADVNDIPSEMTVEEENGHLLSDYSISLQSLKRKRTVDNKVVKRIKPTESRTVPPLVVSLPANIKKITGKRAKPTSKFSRKKYVCPHCNRRFLTRGNVKNHLRIHSRDKLQCPLCQELFAYQAVYQRHLMKHRENNEIGDEELAAMIAESLRLAEENAIRERKSVRVLDDEEQEIAEPEIVESKFEDYVPRESEEDSELIADEEEKIAQRLQTKVAAKSDELGAQFLTDDDNEEATGSKTPEKHLVKGKRSTPKEKNNAPKARMNYQVIECDFCPMKYHKWSAFYIHRCTHTGETPIIPCGICEQEFPNIKALKEHKTTEHRESIFQCELCDRSFLSKSALLMHQPVHSSRLNFQCRYCSEKMRTLKERYVHERVHTADETPYQCSHCDKQFNTLVNLRCHLKVHGKEGELSPS